MQRPTLDLIQNSIANTGRRRPGVLDLEGRIASYELAYRMQAEGLDLGDLSKETEATRRLYGIEQKETQKFGRCACWPGASSSAACACVQLYSGVREPKDGWDAHAELKKNHEQLRRATDQPVAALLTDLKQPGCSKAAW